MSGCCVFLSGPLSGDIWCVLIFCMGQMSGRWDGSFQGGCGRLFCRHWTRLRPASLWGGLRSLGIFGRLMLGRGLGCLRSFWVGLWWCCLVRWLSWGAGPWGVWRLPLDWWWCCLLGDHPWTWGMGEWSLGVKTDLNWSRRRRALLLLSVTIVSLFFRGDTPMLSWRFDLM